MDDAVFQAKYEKYKLRVKLWEKDFKKKNGRIPSKYDIREASKEIRDSYKMYYKLKTSFLENTLNDVLAEDGFDVLDEAADMHFDENTCENINGGPRLPLDISDIAAADGKDDFSNVAELPNDTTPTGLSKNFHSEPVIKDFEPINGVQLALNVHAWGSEVSNKQIEKIQNDPPEAQRKPFKSNLNQKLFKSSSFSKRNPRKSLSRLNSSSFRGSQSNLSMDGRMTEQSREVLPDLETILAQKAKEQQQFASSDAVALVGKSAPKESAIKTIVDQGWLERNTNSIGINGEAGRKVSNSKPVNVKADAPPKRQTYGLSNIDVSKLPPASKDTASVRKVDIDIENRLASVPLPEAEEAMVPKKTASLPKVAINSDSDAVVSNSEDECTSQEYRHIVKRRRLLPSKKSPEQTQNPNQTQTPSQTQIPGQLQGLRPTQTPSQIQTPGQTQTPNQTPTPSQIHTPNQTQRRGQTKIRSGAEMKPLNETKVEITPSKIDVQENIASNKQSSVYDIDSPENKKEFQQVGNSSFGEETEKPKGKRKKVTAKRATKSSAGTKNKVLENGENYSDGDNEKDADYEPSNKPKGNRRKATAKRSSKVSAGNKKALEQNPNSSVGDEEKDADNELDEKPKGKTATAKRRSTKSTKKEPASQEPKAKRQTKAESTKTVRRAPARKSASAVQKTQGFLASKEENQQEDKPLDPADLKYALALDSGDITAVPRIYLDDLELADTIAQRYINNVPAMATKTDAPHLPINEKREAARKKLQEKIASGKLNENFVTINIQKKTFVRGKKQMNYSKYKKKLWKHQKRVNALSGPNMNMGGCDGGVLKCFTCGGVGHFAQNCKIKGDSLLPLTAQLAEDPSPFPTLEEAERMASQSALAVHSRNINKLPAASNAAIYRGGGGSESDVDNENEKPGESGDLPADRTEDENDELLMETDDELENMDLSAAEQEALTQSHNISPIKKYVGHKIPEEFLRQAGLDSSQPNIQSQKYGGVGALYDLNRDGSVKPVTEEVLEALRLFGHTDFRKGQDRAVMRILSGLSTLVTLSTGSGKSLCYQLPAYLYSRQKKSITLVISPLVSLMEDQVTGVPHFLRAHCMHTNQTPQQRMKILQLISDGEIDILLVSPEAVVAGERSTGFGSILRQLPPIAFACIDEAHCVSQWSHNFRPSYLMICKVLKKNLGVKTVLGLTATATLPTRLSIINHLGIHDGESGIISDTPLPDNLILSISKDENRDAALLELLNSERFEPCQSIIIYCTRRDECERIAGFIRTCLQDRKVADPQGKNKRKRINWHAEPYHAGMASSRRRTIQNAFMKNELRIVVATIAFGMGINKPDIRSVIHYNMPRNFESYVQEIGRAGRDGKIAHCHLFLDARGGDQNELRRHIYANSIDRHVIRKLLQRIFVPCSCDKNMRKEDFSKLGGDVKQSSEETDLSLAKSSENKTAPRVHICPGHEIGFSTENTVEALDIPAENISTLLCYMELDSRWNMNVLSSAYIMAKVISYGGPKYLKYAAKECPPLAMAIALEINKKTFKEDCNIIEFSVIDIAAAIGWNSGVVKYQLKNLEWVQVNGYPQRSPISVTFFDLGFRLKAPGDFTSDEIDEALDTLYNRSVQQEKTQLIQLQYVFHGLSSVAYNTFRPCAKADFSHDRSDQLKAIIRDYFCNDYPKDLKLEVDLSNVSDEHITNDVHAMLNLYPDNNFSGRTLARIFHGISSPNYPAVMWGRCKYWRAHSKVDFNRIVQLANGVIVKLRT